MLEVIPLVSTEVNWNQLLVIAKQALGRNVAHQLDSVGMSPISVAAYIATLGAFHDWELRPNDILKDAGPLLKHAFFGFLVISSVGVLMEIMEDTPLNVMSATSVMTDVRISVITGTLEEWRTAIINGLSALSGVELRLFLGRCMAHFESLGLGLLWVNHKKSVMLDKSIILLEKR